MADQNAKPSDSLPRWYAEIFPAGNSRGFFHNLGDHSAVFIQRESRQLVVSFDNLAEAGGRHYNREPWGGKFIAEQNWSHLGIFAQGPTWYRDAALITFLESLRDTGFFSQFDRVAFCGASMGGFAAMAFASLAPGATVLAFSPQTTLAASIVPWEERFAKGRAQDWALPHGDAADELSHAGSVYVVCDPFEALDKQHLDRLGHVPTLIALRAPGLGHKSALLLRRMDRLKPVMKGAIDGTLTRREFARLIRDRRDLYLYKTTMDGHLRARNRPERADRLSRAFKLRRRNREQATKQSPQ
ncbi:hypothetical protein E0K93_19475 [Puniceibacterium sp. HSS470]|nr:hypothetical protein E0K93_19475 [Puniceibacterium sp. HSS470]